MNWGAPGYLVLLAVVVAVALLVAAGGWRHRVVLRRVFAEGLMERLLPASVRRRRLARDVARIVALGLMVVALAEPRFDKQIRTVTTTGADIMLVVDLSRSMDARDVDPSRLERARREVADLGRIRQGDRVGLVIFSGGAYLRLPLTEDFVALENVLAAADTSTFQANGSALGLAVEEGIEALARSESSAGQALLVLSDGEIHDKDAALAAADKAAAAGVRIYAMGIGIESSPVPDGKGGMLRHEGKVVQSVPDFTVLQEMASRTSGAFVQSVASSRDIESLYGGAIRKSLVMVERASRQRETWRAAFQWPLGLAALLWLGGAWLGDGRRRFGMATAALALVVLAAPTVARATTAQEADALYRDGDYGRAAEAFEELSLVDPGDADVFDRLGAARYRSGDFDGAERAYREASRLRGGDPRADFNAGNAAYRSGRLEEALDLYDQAGDLPSATANKQLVEQALEARRQQQPPPPPQGGEDQEQDGDPQDGEGSDSNNPESGQGSGDQEQDEGSDEGSDSEQSSDESADGSQSESGQSGNQGSDQDGSSDAGEQGSDDQEPEGEGSAAVSPDELDPDSQEEGDPQDAQTGGAGGGIDGEDQGPITQGQAERLLDSIEEGSQKIYVRGRGEDKPW